MTTTTIQFTETLVAYDNPFESRIEIVDADTNDTVGTYVNWEAAAVWFVIEAEATTDEQGIDGYVATRRTIPATIPVWALPADTRYIKGACE